MSQSYRSTTLCPLTYWYLPSSGYFHIFAHIIYSYADYIVDAHSLCVIASGPLLHLHSDGDVAAVRTNAAGAPLQTLPARIFAWRFDSFSVEYYHIIPAVLLPEFSTTAVLRPSRRQACGFTWRFDSIPSAVAT